MPPDERAARGPGMIEWLRQDRASPPPRPATSEPPTIALDGRLLPIELNLHPRARRLTLRLAPDGGAVRITLPRWCRSADAIAFAHARAGWLAAQLARIPQRGDPVARGEVYYRGHALALDWQDRSPRRARLVGDRLAIGGPREGLEARLRRWLEGEALRLMSADLAACCARAGLAVPELRLTRAQRRWGSCSSKSVVRLNWRLVQAPDAVRLSVVAHEVAHLVHFDHSPRFHALLADIYEGDLETAEAWLRAHGRKLFADFG